MQESLAVISSFEIMEKRRENFLSLCLTAISRLVFNPFLPALFPLWYHSYPIFLGKPEFSFSPVLVTSAEWEEKNADDHFKGIAWFGNS